MKEKSALAVAIGKEIRRIRLEQRRSQEGLADDCGINRTYMGNVERGEQDISVAMTKRIVSNLGLTLTEFFGKLGE
jgi:transcriptional regulator with XRE-family HTH domain